MAVSINKVGVKYAKSLISRGKVDRESDWTFSDEDSAKLLGADGEDWGHLNKFHLGVRSDALEDTVEFQAYPFGKGGKVFLKGLLDAKEKAKANADTAVVAEIDALLSMIDAGGPSGHVPARSEDSVKVSRGDMYDWRDWQTEKMQKTADGTRLIGRAVITNVGVFRYPQPDGSEMLELRHPDDVFEQESLDSLRGLPLTNDHPMTGVGPDNFKYLTVGSVSSPAHDAYHLTAELSVNDKQAIADVQMGKRALSCGYDCELVPYTDGYLGMPTTHRQKRIRYNHVAIVDAGRAGPAAKMRMDSVTFHSQELTKGKTMKKIRLDHAAGGAEAEVDDLVAVEFGALKTAADSAKRELDAATADVATKKAALDTAQGELAALTAVKTDLEAKLAAAIKPEAVEAMVKARVGLLDTAKGYGIKVEDSWDARKIRESVVALAFPTIDCADKSDEFLEGAFNSAKLQLASGRKNVDGQGSREPARESGGSSHDSTNLDSLLAEARNQSSTTVQNAWKGEKE